MRLELQRAMSLPSYKGTLSLSCLVQNKKEKWTLALIPQVSDMFYLVCSIPDVGTVSLGGGTVKKRCWLGNEPPNLDCMCT